MPRLNVRGRWLILALLPTLLLPACGSGLTVTIGPDRTPAASTSATATTTSPASTTASPTSTTATPGPSTTPSPSATSTATAAPAPGPSPLKNVLAGWRVETVFESSLVNPTAMTLDGDGYPLVVSGGTQEVLRLNPDGSFAPYADTSSLPGIFTIAWQAARSRLLIVDRIGGLYAASGGGLEQLRLFGLFATTVAVAPDGSFYGGLAVEGGSITRYDADGNSKEVVARNVDGCYQVVLDAAGTTLYYSETFAGRVSALDLADKSVRVLATGAGIPGTYEPIALGLDPDGTLYYFTANQGLNRYRNGAFSRVMDSISGVGPMAWSDAERAFLVANQAGSNIIAYDPTAAAARHVTPYLNAWDIVERDDGTVLIADSVVSEVTRDGPVPLAGDVTAPANHLARDEDGNIYAGTADGRLWRVLPDGSFEPWGADFTDWPIVSLSYDLKNRALVAVAGRHDLSRARVWRLPLADPAAPVMAAELDGVRVTPHLPAAVPDDDGNIYIIERQRNVIYRVPDGASAAGVFIENVLENEAITVPGLAYSRVLDGLVVSTIQTYDLWPLVSRKKQTLAENNGGVDNFAVSEGPAGDLVLMTSGRVLRLVPEG